MIRTYRRRLVLSVAGLVATPAFAADPPAAAGDAAPAEIIVTAQKRSEPLQKVPVAVTVVSGEALTRLSTNSIEDAQSIVPALTFVKGDTSLNSGLFLRGLGTVNFSIAAEPSVTSVLDGVVLARAGESFGDLYDIDRIEVLRGPQGTLFGKNSSVGVINVVTKEPSKTLAGYIDAGYFEGNEYKLKASLSGPLGDNWRAGVTGFYSHYDGNIYDQTLNTKINGYKHYGARAQLIGDIGNLRVKVIADYRRADDQCCAFVIGALNPGTSSGVAGAPFVSPTAANLAIESLLPPARGGATSATIAGLANRTKETTYGASLQLDYSLGGHTITSITSWRKWNNEEIRDGDWLDQPYLYGASTRFPLQHDDGPERAHTFTQELRLTSPTGGFVDYVAGLFYYQAVAARTYTRTDTYCVSSTATPLANGLIPCAAGNSVLVSPSGTGNFGSTFDNYAAYGQATWHFTPHVRLVTGLRYTHDKVTAFDLRTDNFTGTKFTSGAFSVAPGGIGANFDANVAAAGVTNGAGFNGTPWQGQTSANNLSGKAALEFDVAPHHMLYGSYSRGYKGPAFNTFFNMQWFNTLPINPELSDAFEVGLKNSFDGGKLILNIDGFYDRIRNYQANYPTTVNGTVTTTIINAGTVSSRGFEVEWLFRPVHNFTVNGGVNYTDAHVDQFNLPPASGAGSYLEPGTPLAFAPKFKGTIGTTYTAELSNAPFNLEFNGNLTYTAKQVSTLQADGGNSLISTAANINNIIAFQELTIQDHAQVDLSIAAIDRNKHYRLAFIVKNLFNNHFASTIGSGGPGGSYEYQIPRDANRYWGVTGRLSF